MRRTVVDVYPRQAVVQDYGVRGMKKGVRKQQASGAKPAGAAGGNSEAPPHARRHKELLSRGFKYVGGGRYNNPKEPNHPIFVNGAGEWTY